MANDLIYLRVWCSILYCTVPVSTGNVGITYYYSRYMCLEYHDYISLGERKYVCNNFKISEHSKSAWVDTCGNKGRGEWAFLLHYIFIPPKLNQSSDSLTLYQPRIINRRNIEFYFLLIIQEVKIDATFFSWVEDQAKSACSD